MKTRNWPLIVGIALPVIFIIIISVVLFVPSMFVNPQHNFLYTTTNQYYNGEVYTEMYTINGGRIDVTSANIVGKPMIKQGAPVLYEYDVKNDASHQISLADAQKLDLVVGPSSPDGYTVSYQYNHDGIFELFGSNNNNYGYYISRGAGKKKLTGIPADRYYGNQSFSVIGWVK